VGRTNDWPIAKKIFHQYVHALAKLAWEPNFRHFGIDIFQYCSLDPYAHMIIQEKFEIPIHQSSLVLA
jgi:hypothetical protein